MEQRIAATLDNWARSRPNWPAADQAGGGPDHSPDTVASLSDSIEDKAARLKQMQQDNRELENC